ncbi:2-C-methyl-D-erythritol 4-phosphate cytidylyltransferase [bacterium]|nr:2-C-methyl-D-erythritol 4-phosphate cytidylyltransferase [bacterium]
MKHIAIILASGSGSRFGTNIPKQFFSFKGKTVLEHSIEAFQNNNFIDNIIVVCNPDYRSKTVELSKKYSKVINIVNGGETRQQSSYNGVFSVNENNCNVLIHDAARPFVSNKIINDCIAALKEHKAVNVAIEATDTIIVVDENNIIKSVPNRKTLRRCQTPQCFDLNLIKKAHKLAKNDKQFIATDDCGLVIKYNLSPVYVVKGSEDNIKITFSSDIKNV